MAWHRLPMRTYSRNRGPARGGMAGILPAGALAGAGRTGPAVGPFGLSLGPLPLPGAPQPDSPGEGDSSPPSPYTPSRPTQTTSTTPSPSPGERPKPSGTWAAREVSGTDGNTKQIIERESNKIDNDLGNYDGLAKIAKDIYDNHSGRLVVYSSDTDTDSDNASVQERAGDLSPHPAPSTPASPSPSPEQSRRNAQGEAVLNTFGSRGILYLLGGGPEKRG